MAAKGGGRGYRIILCLVLGWALLVAGARAEDLSLPTFRSFAGAFLVSRDHNFFVESEVDLPLLHDDVWTVAYHHKESTPFLDLDHGVQADLLYARDELQLEWQPADWVRVVAVSGDRRADYEDRAGKLNTYVFGAGFASPRQLVDNRLQWMVLAGGYVDRTGFNGQWWTDANATWRLWDFVQDHYLGSKYHAIATIAGDLDGVYSDNGFHALYRVGPQVEFATANGNNAKLELRWYYNDDNPFYGVDENGLLLGLQITSSHDDPYVLHARTDRQPGWFPLVWGDYDVSPGDSRVLTRFTMHAEVVDVQVLQHLVTGTVWYENRQEYRSGDYDNVNYSVTLGVQTPVGLASPLSQGDPLVAGCDFLHRSDHALNPDNARVLAEGQPTSIGTMLVNGSLNLLPRFRLQTIGWDLPYRDPSMYDPQTRWLGSVNWRVTAGYASNASRNRERFSGQIGGTCDIASVSGFVPYVTGIGSCGDETPDYLLEAGVRRPAGKIFVRWETYGVNHDLAHGKTLSAGIGVNL